MLRTLWKWLAATFSIVVILLAIGIGLFRLLLPMIPQYHERIETFASEAAGTPVRIEHISARWGWNGPELRFENARLLTAGGDEVLLRADEGRIVIDLGPLLSRREFRAGQVQLDGLEIEVLRDAQNGWHIGGRRLAGRNETTLPSLSLGLREARVVYRDEMTGAGPWVFEDVELDVDLSAGALAIETELRLPPGLGRSAELSLQSQGELADFDNLDWQLYVRGDDIEVFGWQALMPAGRVVPAAGRGDVVLWFGARGGTIQQLNLQTDLRDLEFSRDAQTTAELDLLRGRFEYDRLTGGWQAVGRDVTVADRGETWPAVSFNIEQAGDGSDSLLYADLNYARLDNIVPLADWIPDPQLRGRVAALDPRGVIEDLSVRVVRQDGAAGTFSVRARFDGLGFEAVDAYPGFDRLAGALRVDNNGGQLDLAPRAVRIDVPRILGAPLATERLSGTVVWRRSPGEWRILSNSIDIEHPQFLAATNFELTFEQDQSPRLDLHADLSRMTAAGLRGLLPEPVLPPKLYRYLKGLMVAGEVPSVSVDWRGAIADFPFDDDTGEFSAVAEVRNATVDYARGWPLAEEVDGTLLFRNASFMAGVSRGKMVGNRVSSAEMSIADMRNSVFEMHTVTDGLLNSLHTFLKASPIAERSGDVVLNRLSLAGDGSAQVDLEVPLGRKAKQERKMDLSVIVSTESGEARLSGIDEPLEQISGSLQFRNGDFSAREIAARVLGAPVSIDVMTDEVESGDERYRATIATARGQADSREIARLNKTVGDFIQGQASYTATVVVPAAVSNRPLNIGIATRLEGMAVNLPSPFTKRAGEARDLVLDISLPPGAAQTDGAFGDVAAARLNWLRDDGGGWRFERGGLKLGTGAASLPEGPGLAVTGKTDLLDLDGFLDLGTGGGSPGLVRNARVEAVRLDAFGERLSNATLSVDRNEREWLVQIDSPTAAGALFVPFELDGNEIIANMQVLHIGTGTGAGEERESELSPRDIPAITLQADDFRIGDMRLGRLQARLVKDADGIVLEEYSTEAETFSSAGKGLWEITRAGQRCEFEFTLRSSDLQPTLSALGFQPLIDASDAQIVARLSWPGAPDGNFREQLNGEVSVKVGPGQIDTVEPGAGRALGLLSFTALPRRLSLDFRDVFDKGFGFDYIEGDFTLDTGDAFTSNLVLEGPAAQVGIAGRTGLVARDYDQSAVVYGNFGGALPVAGAIAGGPVGGAAMLIFSELFKRPLQNLARVNYRITGPWDDPAVERVFVDQTEEGTS